VPRPSEIAEAAAALSPLVRLGTSSWTFPGWDGLVYSALHTQAELACQGLTSYASHPLMRTVGLDRAFYRPLGEDLYRDLASQVPADFRFLVKAYQGITRPTADERGRTHGDTAAPGRSRANPLFLDADYAIDHVVGPATGGLGGALGPVLFQFPPLEFGPRTALEGIPAFLDRVAEFLARMPRGPVIAVEVRNAEILRDHAGHYAAALRAGRAVHSFAGHPAMPPIADQAAALMAAGTDLTTSPLCVRWLLRRDQTYGGAKDRYHPFNAIIDDDTPARLGVAELVKFVTLAGRPSYVIVNNKAEGSAPLSIERLAQHLVRQRDRDDRSAGVQSPRRDS